MFIEKTCTVSQNLLDFKGIPLLFSKSTSGTAEKISEDK